MQVATLIIMEKPNIYTEQFGLQEIQPHLISLSIITIPPFRIDWWFLFANLFAI